MEKNKGKSPSKSDLKTKELNTARQKTAEPSKQMTPGHHPSKSMSTRAKVSLTPRT